MENSNSMHVIQLNCNSSCVTKSEMNVQVCIICCVFYLELRWIDHVYIIFVELDIVECSEHHLYFRNFCFPNHQDRLQEKCKASRTGFFICFWVVLELEVHVPVCS